MTTPYIRLTTDVLSDPKILAIGPEAFGLWVRGLLYSKLHLTDGFVPRVALSVIAPTTTERQQNDDETTEERRENDSKTTRKRRENVAKLIRVGLWNKVEGGWTIGAEKWARYQTTREEVEAFRQANREKVKRFRQRQRNQCNADVTGYTQLGVTDTQSQSQSQSKEEKKEEELVTCAEMAPAPLLPGFPETASPPTEEPIPEDLAKWLADTTHFQGMTANGSGKFWATMIAAYDRYDWIFFEDELRKADAYLATNPQKIPRTPKGLKQFVRNWFNNAVEYGRKRYAITNANQATRRR